MGFDFEKKRKEIQRKKRNLPRKVANIAKNHFLQAFKDQGFTDTTLSPWAARKTRDRSDRRNPTKKRAILTKTGALKRSIRVGKASFKRIEVGSYGIAYSSRHNRGLAGMPERRFIGSSAKMNRLIRAKVRSEIKKVL